MSFIHQYLASAEPDEYFKMKALDHVAYMDKVGGDTVWV